MSKSPFVVSPSTSSGQARRTMNGLLGRNTTEVVDTRPADFERSARECAARPNRRHTQHGSLRLPNGTIVRHPVTLPIEGETDRMINVRFIQEYGQQEGEEWTGDLFQRKTCS